MNTFSAGSCIRFGWETFKKRPWFFIGVYLLLFVITGAVSAILNTWTRDGGVNAALAAIVRVAFELLVGIGSISFALKAHDDVATVSISDFWHPRSFWSYVGASILTGIIVVFGLILVIIPGIIWALMFGLAGYLVVDKALGPIEALKESKRITYGNRWELFLLGILSILTMILGVICLLVGVLVAYPVTTIAVVHAYRTLSHSAPTTTPAI